MHYVKATIQYAMSSPQDESKKRYLDENEGVIDTTPLDIPRPIPTNHPLAHNMSIKQILLSMQSDIKTLEKAEYERLVADSHARTTTNKPVSAAEEKKAEEDKGLSKYSAQIAEEARKRSGLAPLRPRGSPQRAKSKPSVGGVAILGTYVRNPKTPAKDAQDTPAGGAPQRIPSVRAREKPTKRLEQELLMFKEIFVHPKESKLEELREKDRFEQQQETNLLLRAKRLQEAEASERAANKGARTLNDAAESSESKKLMSVVRGSPGKMKKVVGDDKELKALLEEPEALLPNDGSDALGAVDEVIDIVMRMFNSRLKSRAGESFFSQQIQVQPPEGLNATVAAPLTPGGGWAPSIPSLTGALNKASFKVTSRTYSR